MQLHFRATVLALAIAGSGIAAYSSPLSHAQETVPMTSLETEINAIKTEHDFRARVWRMSQLSMAIRENPRLVNDADIDFLGKTLSDKDDFIRLVAAGILGFVGPHAQHIAPQRHRQSTPYSGAVFANEALVHPIFLDFVGDQTTYVVNVGIQVVGMGDVLKRFRLQLFARVSEDVA